MSLAKEIFTPPRRSLAGDTGRLAWRGSGFLTSFRVSRRQSGSIPARPIGGFAAGFSSFFAPPSRPGVGGALARNPPDCPERRALFENQGERHVP